MTDIQAYDYRSPTLSDKGIYYFCGDFTQPSVKDAITWIMDSNLDSNFSNTHLTMMITSQGGDLFAAFALIDVMRGSKLPIHTVGLGIIASAGLLTCIAGEHGYRTVTPNTSILSHQWSWGAFGKEHELVSTQKQYDLTTKRMIAHYKKCTNLEEEVIREKLLPPQDIWLSAEEAKKYGLVDKIRNLK
jgi:ATP-dependent Clp protease protease subunit